MRYDVTRIESPFGGVVLVTSPTGLHALEFADSDRPEDWRFARTLDRPEFARTRDGGDVARRVAAYFDGEIRAIDAVRVAASGTQFQQRVWTELRRIRPGTVVSYGAVAAAIGRPGAARAVGRANALNPIAVVVPCHRVVGADGTLTGYAFGLGRKQDLLAHERAHAVASAIA
jgi:methylated-DNA-[protein]-cysteine S-methyltransferase